MISNLLVLNSSYSGCRDLTWVDDPLAVRGYMVYRAFDAPVNWELITPNPIPGTFFRDRTELEVVEYTVQPGDWVDDGTMGMRIFKIPHVPYTEVVKGRPVVASSPDDVRVEITDNKGNKTIARPGQVDGVGQTIWLRIDKSLPGEGAVSAFPLINFDTAVSFKAIYRRLTNFVDISISLVRTFYTVVPVGDKGEMHAPGALDTPVVNSMEVEQMDYIFQAMVTRNGWIFEQVAEPAYIFFRRTKGEICGCTKEGMEMPRHNCPACHEVGIVGGYYGPFDFPFIDPDQQVLRTLDEGGVKVERHSQCYLGPTPLVQDGDIIVRYNGERLVISGVVYKSPRGTLLQQGFDVGLLPRKDTRYLIPIAAPATPLIYNPVTQSNPLNGVGGADPLFSTATTPERQWENKNTEIARTLTWGRIMT